MMGTSNEEADWKLEKAKPTRIEFLSFAELPNIDELVALAQTVDWLLFQTPITVTVIEDGEWDDPTASERQELVAALIPYLPQGVGRYIPTRSGIPASRAPQ